MTAIEREPVALMVVGYVVWNRNTQHVFGGRVHFYDRDAEKVRQGIVWHNRDGFEVREVLLGGKVEDA